MIGERVLSPSQRHVRSLGVLAKRFEQPILGVLGVAVFVAAWQAFTMSGSGNQLLFPGVGPTVLASLDLFRTGEILPHLLSSSVLFITSLATCILVGIPLGFLAGWFPTVRGLLAPHIALLYSLPSIGLLPLFIVWLGFGFPSQYAIVLLFAFFPPYYAALESVRTADSHLLRVAKSYGASDLHLFRAVILPGSIPLLLSGIRFSVGKAINGVILVELYGSTSGLGYLLTIYGQQYMIARVFAVILVIAICGLATSVALRWAEDRFDAWRPGRTANY